MRQDSGMHFKALVGCAIAISLTLSSCGGSNALSDCQEKGYAKFVNAHGRRTTTEEVKTITQMCEKDPTVFDK